MRAAGFSIVELMISLTIAAMLMISMQQVFSQTMALKKDTALKNRALRDVDFAMQRMIKHARHSKRLLLPSRDRPATAFNEAIRDEQFGVSGPMAVLAITLPDSVDRDGNNFSDADNDRDGQSDEDTSGDITNDDSNGIHGIDDDGDSTIDESFFSGKNDDDEYLHFPDEDPLDGLDTDNDGTVDEDWGADQNNDGQPGIAGVDDDGDGQIDEGSKDDDDEDGLIDEDWLDPVVFFLSGQSLIERQPVPWDVDGDTDVDGRDYIETVILEDVTHFRIERVATIEAQYPLLDITIETSSTASSNYSLHSRIRVGSGL